MARPLVIESDADKYSLCWLVPREHAGEGLDLSNI